MENLDLYSRQQSLNLFIPNEVIVVGLGGTGVWVALFLAMSGVQHLHLMDDDNLELSNLNRLPFTLDRIGLPKTEAIKELLEAIRPDILVDTYGKANDMSLEMVDGRYLFDCTDRASTQAYLKRKAKERAIEYRRVGYNGLHLTVTDTVPEWSTVDRESVGYSITPSWVVPAAMAGCLGVMSVLYRYQEVNHYINEVYQ